MLKCTPFSLVGFFGLFHVRELIREFEKYVRFNFGPMLSLRALEI
jgi:hypothetical protein